MFNFENHRKGRDALDAEIDAVAEEAEAEALDYWQRVKTMRGDPAVYKEYVAELRKKNPLELTAEEIAVLHEGNEKYHGDTPDFTKIERYGKIESVAQCFMDKCDEVARIEKLRPNPHERHALVCVDLKFAATLDQRETAMLTELLQLADRVTVSANGEFTRFSLAVENIWEEV